MQSAIDNRAVDTHLLFRAAGGRALCTAAEHALGYASAKVSTAIIERSHKLYSGRVFRSMARLDVPTWDDPSVSSQFSALNQRRSNTETVAWTAINVLLETGSAFLRMFSEAAVLFRVMWEQGDGSLLVLVSVASEAVSIFAFRVGLNMGDSKSGVISSVVPQ